MHSQDPPRSRVHELGRLSRTSLIAAYQAWYRNDRYEVAFLDRDRLIAAILDLEAGQSAMADLEAA